MGAQADEVGIIDGVKLDWLVIMLGHCGIIKGCSC